MQIFNFCNLNPKAQRERQYQEKHLLTGSWAGMWKGTKELSLVFCRPLSYYRIVYRENKMFEFNTVCNHIVHVRSYLTLRLKILNGQAGV